jgi:uncharacterized protein (DUF2141 family)
MKKLIILAICVSYVDIAKSQTISITVFIDNVTSNEGVIKVCVFNKAEAFPDKTNLAVKCVSAKATKGSMKIQVDGLVSGRYALAAHHDKNNDTKVNTNFFGIPKEPTGASNGAKGKMGPPKFEDAVLVVDKNKTEFVISLE